MATKTKAAVLDETLDVEETEELELTTKQIINEGIARVIDATGIDVQKNRYKAMRAIAFQAFANAIAAGEFDALVDEAIENVDELPAGWEIERSEKDEAPAKAPVKKAPAKAAEKAPAKAPAKKAAAKPAAKPAAAARRRPTR